MSQARKPTTVHPWKITTTRLSSEPFLQLNIINPKDAPMPSVDAISFQIDREIAENLYLQLTEFLQSLKK